MKTLKNFLILSLCAGALASCTKDADIAPDTDITTGKEVMVKLNMTIEDETAGDPSTAQTRSIVDGTIDEGTALGSEPKNIWLIQYNENDVLVGAPRYIDLTDPTNDVVPVVHSGTSTHTLIVIANTHDEFYQWGDIKTLDKLKASTRTIFKESDCYSPANDLIMNGVFKSVMNETTQLNVKLYRNIVKLTLNIENAPTSGLTLVSAQVFNVPASMYFADRLYGDAEGICPALGSSAYIDYPVESFVGNPGETKNMTWYIPRNEMGTTASTETKQKNLFAPANSTYIRIIAKDSEGYATIFTFYPGGNMRNNHNLTPNKHYLIDVKLTGKGDPDQDSRIEDYGIVDLGISNSYILNPAPAGTQQRIFKISATNRVNEFWNTRDVSNVINSGDKWVATLLWQDVSNVDFIRFVQNNELKTTFAGTGHEPIALTANSAVQGNAVIGIQRANANGNPIGDYLWTWHLWATDYNPSIKRVPVAGQYIYPLVGGGDLHRYNDADGYEVWNGNGMYKDKYIMDRNLGSRNTTNDGTVSLGVLHYQYGRKDPFPGNVTLYDIVGGVISISQNPAGTDQDAPFPIQIGQSTIQETVRKPTTFMAPQTNISYASDANYSTVWYNPVADGSKSLFDPCPEGWCIPADYVWNDFRRDASDPSNSTILAPERPELEAFNNGFNYWPTNTIQASATKIFYPGNGSRTASTAAFSNEGRLVAVYGGPVRNVSSAYILSVNYASTVLNGWTYSGLAAQVRCIQE